MPGPLDDLRIIDLTNGPVGGIATMILADFGADVIKVERPGGDPFRFLPNAPMWLRGKQSVELDLKREVERNRLFSLIETADVVVTSFRAHAGVDLGADYDVLSYRNAGLVYCQISGFGPYGPYVGYPGYEGVVAAKSGRMMSLQGIAARPGPQFATGHVASHTAAQAAVTGILAALIARDRVGFGQYLETSLLQAMMRYDGGGQPDSSEDGAASGLADDEMPPVDAHPVLTRDGVWLQIDARRGDQFERLLAATGLVEAAGRTHRDTPALWPELERETFRDRLLQRMRERTAEEWLQRFAEHGVIATAFQATQDALDDPRLVEHGHVAEIRDPRGTRLKTATSVMEAVLGFYGDADHVRPAMKQLGLLARLGRTPGEIRGEIPGIGEHTIPVLAERRTPWQPFAEGDRSGAPALAEVTVLDVTRSPEGALGTSVLAELGARVIKVEDAEGAEDAAPARAAALPVDAGKESIALDLAAEDAPEILRRLVATADVVVSDLPPAEAERAGLSYEQARAAREDLLYVHLQASGGDRPEAYRPASNEIVDAAIGATAYQAGEGMLGPVSSLDNLRLRARRLARANDGSASANTGAVLATAILLGLRARHRDGRGQEVWVDALGANAWANADDFFWYDEREPRPVVDEDLLGTGPLYRLYRCSEGWIFLAIVLDKEWERFCRRIGTPELLTDPRFATRLAREENAAALADLLEHLFTAETADEWERQLTVAGLGCVRADGPLPAKFFATDEQVAVNEYVYPVPGSDAGGQQLRYAPVVRFRRTRNIVAAAPTRGEHTVEILEALGYERDIIERFQQDGVAWSPTGAPSEAER